MQVQVLVKCCDDGIEFCMGEALWLIDGKAIKASIEGSIDLLEKNESIYLTY